MSSCNNLDISGYVRYNGQEPGIKHCNNAKYKLCDNYSAYSKIIKHYSENDRELSKEDIFAIIIHQQNEHYSITQVAIIVAIWRWS